ncbi:MAG: protein-L-isoaspartate(D-aspartate) O-methyltransferase [Acidiferrobacterales bacterium]|nr:protein-L-isoaspartate(D-aspartate) O-methyltransferase [Acidiferrobacterales bacterium]
MLATAIAVAADDRYVTARDALLREIAGDARITSDYTGRVAFDPRVMDALANVPRHEFVPPDLQTAAYENRPLPIGYGQTISQPYIVALMTDMLNPKSGDVMLEVGTGSGYQAAVLAKLIKQVYTIEIIPPLAKRATERLKRLRYDNVTTRVGDGYYGWEAHAPFDGIIVTAAATQVPPPLIKQLKPGGRMVIPVGSRFLTQELLLVEKTPTGDIKTRQILPVRFVPLTGGH